MTRSEFENNIEKLKKRNPGHDIIIVLQERGYDPLAVEYLKLALAEPIETTEVSAARLFKQKDTLYSRRAQLSNKFHDCTSDKERAEISVAIGSIQSEIIENRRALELFQATGKVPKPVQKLALPHDGRRKEKKLRSVRSSISYFRGKIREETDPDKIKQYEAKLTELHEAARELSA